MIINNNTYNLEFKVFDKFQLKYCILCLIILLGSALRIYNLGNKSLWGDEFLSIYSSRNLGKIVSERGHPPLFFIILFFFRYLGESEYILRLPSAIFGIITIFVMYEVGSVLFGRKEGLISAFLLSISPFHIHYSQEARMYSLLTLFSLLSLFFYYKAIKENKNILWLCFIGSTTINLYTHFFAVFIVIFEVTYFIFFFVKNTIVSHNKQNKHINLIVYMFIASMIIIFFLYLPWSRKTLLPKILYEPSRTSFVNRTFWMSREPMVPLILTIFSKFSAGYGFPLFIFLGFFIFGLILNLKKEEVLMSLLWIVLPIILVFTMTEYIRPMIDSSSIRYIIFVLPIYILIVSRGIVNVIYSVCELYSIKFEKFNPVKKTDVRLITFFIIMFLFINISITPIHGYYNNIYDEINYKPYYGKEDWKGVVEYLATRLLPGDVVIIEPEWFATHLSYYFGVDLNVTLHRERAHEQNKTFKYIITNLPKFNVEDIVFVFIRNNVTVLEDVISNNDRVWVIFIEKDITKEISNWFYGNYGLGQQFAGYIHVHLIQPKLFKVAIFKNDVWASWIQWNTVLNSLQANTTILEGSNKITGLNLSEYKAIIFCDFIRHFDDDERQYLEEYIRKGLIVILTGDSPTKLEGAVVRAGDAISLTRISEWFGATMFSVAPKNERWKVKFNEKASDINPTLDLNRKYEFYQRSRDWSSPSGCVLQPDSVSYAKIFNEKLITVFIHKYGKGSCIYIGPKGFAFSSTDADIFKVFVRELIRLVLSETP